MNMEDCLREGYLRKTSPDPALIEKEFRESEYDLGRAKSALQERDYKWAIIQSYYSMFHAARAALFSLGLKERRHFAVQIVLEHLAKEGKLESEYLDYFSACMEAREDADYRYFYSEESSEHSLNMAGEFLTRMKKLLRNLDKKAGI